MIFLRCCSGSFHASSRASEISSIISSWVLPSCGSGIFMSGMLVLACADDVDDDGVDCVYDAEGFDDDDDDEEPK